MQMKLLSTRPALLEIILEASLSILAKAVIDTINALPSEQSPGSSREIGDATSLVKVAQRKFYALA